MTLIAKRVTATALALALVSGSALAAAPTSFRDVKAGDWYHTAVMETTKAGIFSGKAVGQDGVGTFEPQGTLTVAELITVAVKLVAKDGVAPAQGPWYQGYADYAYAKGMVDAELIANEPARLERPATRNEVAMILVRTMQHQLGQMAGDATGAEQYIGDYGAIPHVYQQAVAQMYAMGIVGGKDAQTHAYGGDDLLTRAEAAQMLYKVVDQSQRKPVDMRPATQGSWREGSDHAQPKEGDVVTRKASGNLVVLESKYEVLGAMQGVDLYGGMVMADGQVVKNGTVSDGVISPVKGDRYLVDERTGEGHFQSDWLTLKRATNMLVLSGSGLMPGQVVYSYWMWMGPSNGWMWIGPNW